MLAENCKWESDVAPRSCLQTSIGIWLAIVRRTGCWTRGALGLIQQILCSSSIKTLHMESPIQAEDENQYQACLAVRLHPGKLGHRLLWRELHINHLGRIWMAFHLFSLPSALLFLDCILCDFIGISLFVFIAFGGCLGTFCACLHIKCLKYIDK